jgi:hypothetical protein
MKGLGSQCFLERKKLKPESSKPLNLSNPQTAIVISSRGDTRRALHERPDIAFPGIS